jgi:hypothetical protein
MPIICFGFGKANIKSTLFVSNSQLISMESSTKPKQTGPKSIHVNLQYKMHEKYGDTCKMSYLNEFYPCEMFFLLKSHYGKWTKIAYGV